MIGTVVFGLLPVIYGILDQIDDLYAYLNEKIMIHIYSHGRGAGKSHLRNCFTGPTPKNERSPGRILTVIKTQRTICNTKSIFNLALL
jgi:hypothetical protein